MAQWLKQSTAATVKAGPFVDESDGFTAMTGLTISQADIRLSKNGGAYAQSNNAAGATHDEGGEYGVPLDTTDTNTLGRLKLRIHESGALPVWMEFMVVPANVWDALFGADKLEVDVAQWLGTAAATPTVAGVPEVDVTHVAGTTTPASNLAASAGAMLTGAFETGTLSTTQATTSLTDGLQLNGRALVFRPGGAGEYQAATIIGEVGADGLLTFTPVGIAPVNTDTFVVV